MLAAIINVGANASHLPLQSPIFDDDTFEFIPIPEQARLPSGCKRVPTYADLLRKQVGEVDANDYLPSKFLMLRMHNDPDFSSFTYGDYPTKSPRASNLQLLSKGDYLFFLARLVRWRKGRFTGPAGFYLVGFLEVGKIARNVESADSINFSEFGSNAHVLRALCRKKLWDGFWLFKGTPDSRRFGHAVPFDREIVTEVLRDRREKPWRWGGGRSDLQIIGSYTRSCRVITNQLRVRKLLKWVDSHEGD